QDAEDILVVHLVEEWKACKQPRCVQDFKERLVHPIAWIAIARTIVKAAANPRFKMWQDLRLDTGLCVDRISPLLLGAPLACLARAPDHEIHSSFRRLKLVRAVSAKCPKADVTQVFLTHSQRP